MYRLSLFCVIRVFLLLNDIVVSLNFRSFLNLFLTELFQFSLFTVIWIYTIRIKHDFSLLRDWYRLLNQRNALLSMHWTSFFPDWWEITVDHIDILDFLLFLVLFNYFFRIFNPFVTAFGRWILRSARSISLSSWSVVCTPGSIVVRDRLFSFWWFAFLGCGFPWRNHLNRYQFSLRIWRFWSESFILFLNLFWGSLHDFSHWIDLNRLLIHRLSIFLNWSYSSHYFLVTLPYSG